MKNLTHLLYIFRYIQDKKTPELFHVKSKWDNTFKNKRHLTNNEK